MNTDYAFYGYEKIPENLNAIDLSPNELKKAYQLPWVATEKIHGANFSISIEKETFTYNKRKEPLRWNDDFFGFQIAIEKIMDSLSEVPKLVRSVTDFDKVVVYGEIFGGHYPHPGVAEDSRVLAIQTGVYYSPTIEFCAFDIAVLHQAQKKYLDYSQAIDVFKEAGLFYSAALISGTLNDVLNYNIKSSSTIPQRLGLPKLDQDNIMEGIVIKPLHNLSSFFEQGYQRPIIKLKNQQFKESDEYNQSQKWRFIPNNYQEEIDWLLPDILSFLNENRLNSAISKVGTLHPKNIERIKQIKDVLLEDVMESFVESYSEFVKEVSPLAWKEIQRILKTNITVAICKKFE
jgi:Rnl2 family RNA ligase